MPTSTPTDLPFPVPSPRPTSVPIPTPTPAPSPKPTAAPTVSGCADGTREGFTNENSFPNIAACAGTYYGNINGGDTGGLCSDGWSFCDGSDIKSLSISYSDATSFGGCFAVNSASDCNACYITCESQTNLNSGGCWDASGGFDMDGVGSSCSLNSGRTSCLASGMVRANDNAGCTWNSNGGNSRTGITCCKD